MRESNRILEQRNDRLEAGRAREVQLLAAIEADDADLTLTLRLWRDDVITRLPSDRPAVCRLPRCIADRLRVDRRVMIDERNAVWSFPKGQSKGLLLVAGM